jgi:hypothetical protein
MEGWQCLQTHSEGSPLNMMGWQSLQTYSNLKKYPEDTMEESMFINVLTLCFSVYAILLQMSRHYPSGRTIYKHLFTNKTLQTKRFIVDAVLYYHIMLRFC